MAATHQQDAKQRQKDAQPNQENIACGTAPSGENGIRGTRPTFASVCYLHLVTAASFVTGDYRRTPSATAVCANLMWDTLQTRCCIRDVTLFFLRFTMVFASVCLPPLSQQMLPLDATADINSETTNLLHHLLTLILCSLYSNVEFPHPGSRHQR